MDQDDIHNLAPLLLLAVRQLDAAMLDASAEAELLSRAVASLGERGAHLRDTGGDTTQAKALPIIADAQRAMRALQFHDRLSQRVTHVRDALARLHAVVATGEGEEWRKVREAIRASFTMEDERQIFDALVATGSRPKLQRDERDEHRDPASSGSVEIF
ncbi:MAG TPA: hypothetical protein VMF52_07235 [Steroidobacteraceae bacterium]|nr:hypothetical protein [Steroidobacteraceae bacterium]